MRKNVSVVDRSIQVTCTLVVPSAPNVIVLGGPGVTC